MASTLLAKEILQSPDDELYRLILDESLSSALQQGTPNLCKFTQRLTTQSVTFPFIRPEVALLLEEEFYAATAGRACRRYVLTSYGDTNGEVGNELSSPLAARVTNFITESVFPKLLPMVSDCASPICAEKFAYMLRYVTASADQDAGRVFKCHTDDSDMTLVICFGSSRGWRGANLIYVEQNLSRMVKTCTGALARPGTPDLEDPEEIQVQHEHELGGAVLHFGEAYHMVTPLEEGERLSLVVFGMLDDAPWKRSFYSEMAESMKSSEKAA